MFRFARWYSVALLVFLLALGAGRAKGQGVGAIEGTVTDTQQLPLPGATVEVLNPQGVSVAKIINLNDGTYRVDRLPDGMYIVEFSAPGFATFRKTGVVIAGGQSVTVNAVLQPQTLTSNVTVTAQVQDENIASKTDIPASALPVTTETVSRDLIDQQADTNIISVLNNLPAAYASTWYGSLDYWEFRGLMQDNNYNSARLLNGIPILGNVSDSQINSVQEIDVLKGPASMLYGTQDPGGTVNIVEKWPVAESQQELVLHGGYWGTNGVEFGTTGPLTKSDNLLYRVDIGYIDSDGFRDDSYKKLNLTPKLFWRITPKDRLKFNFHWDDDHFGMDSGVPLVPTADPIAEYPTGGTYNFYIAPGQNINARYNTPGDFEDLNYRIIQGFYEHDFNDHMTFRASAMFQQGGDQYWQNEGNAVIPPGTPDSGPYPYTILRGPSADPYTYSLYFFHHDDIGFNQEDLVGSFHLFGWKHQYMIGYELDQFYHKTARSDDAGNLSIPPENLYDPVETSGAVTQFPSTGDDAYDGIRYWQNAVYFQDYVTIHPKLQVLFGGRFDALYTYNFNLSQNGDTNTFTYSTNNAFEQNPFTYRVGVTSPLTPFMTLYANWSTSFTAQSEVSTAGNALKPESGQQAEAGVRFSFVQNRINLNLAYFHIDETNIAETLFDGTIIQNASQVSYGGEAELRARLTSKLNIYTSYGINPTYFGQFITTSYFTFYSPTPVSENLQGNVPPLVPKITLRPWVTYQLPKGFLILGGAHYVSKRATDAYDLFWLPSYLTFDVGLAYRRARMEYSLNLMNITNRTYWLTAIDDTEIYPGQPFNIVATARFYFGKE